MYNINSIIINKGDFIMKKNLLCILMGAIITTSCITTNVLASSKSEKTGSNISTTVYEKTSMDDRLSTMNDTDIAYIAYDNLLENDETEENITITVYPKKSENQTNEAIDDVNDLYDNSILRGNSAPTTYHDLTSSDYYYSIPDYVTYTYTNRYFNPSYKNEISIQTIGLDSAGKNIDIILYEVNGSAVATWTGNPEEIEGVGFNGLSTSKHYYFQIKANMFSKVKGSGKIHHHYK